MPSGAPHWAGNVKKYHIGTAADGSIQVLDADGNLAVDATTGNFISTARSEWSSEVDGADALKGGVRGRMTADRNIYTDVANQGANVVLNAANNRFHEDNELLTAAMLGVPDNERLSASSAASTQWRRAAGSRRVAARRAAVLISYGGTDDNLISSSFRHQRRLLPCRRSDADDRHRRPETFRLHPERHAADARGPARQPGHQPAHKA